MLQKPVQYWLAPIGCFSLQPPPYGSNRALCALAKLSTTSGGPGSSISGPLMAARPPRNSGPSGIQSMAQGSLAFHNWEVFVRVRVREAFSHLRK